MIPNTVKLAFEDKKENKKGSGTLKLVAGERWRKKEGFWLEWRDSKCLGQETREGNKIATRTILREVGGEGNGVRGAFPFLILRRLRRDILS